MKEVNTTVERFSRSIRGHNHHSFAIKPQSSRQSTVSHDMVQRLNHGNAYG